MKRSVKAGSKRKIFGSRILEKAKKIRFLLLDVDGVMTDGKIYYDSEGGRSRPSISMTATGSTSFRRQGSRLGSSPEENLRLSR